MTGFLSRAAPFGVVGIATIVALSLVLSPTGSDAVGNLIVGSLLLITGIVGAFIRRGRPGNLVGAMLLGIALIAAAAMTLQEYAVAALTGTKALPGGMVAGWLALWFGTPAVGLALLLILAFPTGTLPSPRWRIVAGAIVGGTLAMAAITAFTPGPMPAIPSVDNPLGFPGSTGVIEAVSGVTSVVVLVSALAAVFSQILRLRRASPEEAEQIKIVAYAIGMAPVLIFVSQAIIPRGGGDQWLEFGLNLLAAASIPVAIGVAVLKHRLYDIDVIINRTLVYAGLTASLLASYLLIVVILSRLLEPVTRDSDIAVAASTLAVAALFRPLRARIQSFIDRRFYRAKYDAKTALDRLSIRLRDEVGLDLVRTDVLGVVANTVQPSHASLWLRYQEGVGR